jgi:uncharacterized protein (DUF1015 family)
MAEIKPFRGYRPPPDLASRVAGPPYDVLDSAEARVLAEGNPISFLHVCKPEIDLPVDVPLYDDRVYAKGRDNLRGFIREGVLVRDALPALYVYRQRMGEHVQTGLTAAASVDEYADDRIKKHELTRKDKEDDRTRHVDEQDANGEPVFLTYRARPEIDAIVRRVTAAAPVYDFVAADRIGHTLWVVDDEATIGALRGAFSAIDASYVADGHHRSASAWRVRELRRTQNPHHTGEEPYNFFMAVFFPHDQLAIMDYNRVVKDLGGMTEAVFLAKVAERFTVEPATKGRPAKATTFGMLLGGRWYRLSARPGSFPADDPVRSLDVSILQENLLAPILGITDPRTDRRIDFVGGIRGIGELERRCGLDAKVAFAMHPTSVDQLMAIADAGRIMPPKSTWFEPKLRSGLVVRLYE